MTRRTPGPPPKIRGYRYLSDLGVGGYSSVHLYLQEVTDRQVAVKVLHVPGSDAADTAIAEAKVMAKFERQPNIVQIYDAGMTDDGQPFIIMSYCPGPDLWTLAKQGPLRIERALRVGVLMADAIHTAHSFGVVHRDIKPANILTDDAQVPWLTDFGIAGRLAADDDTDFGYSLPWTPPEILDGAPASRETDVYSLGATLWNLLVGHSPFEVAGDNAAEAMTRRIRKQAPRRTGRDLPRGLEPLLQEMLAKRPGERPASAGRVAERLKAIEKAMGGPPADTDRAWHAGSATAVAAPEVEDRTIVRPRVQPITPPAQVTRVPRPPQAEPAPPPRPFRGRRLALVGGAALLVAALVWAISLVRQPSAPGYAVDTSNSQDAGALGDDIPPGPPTVTATRVNASTLRFTWTYSAPLDSDSFLWQTADGTVSDRSEVPTIDLPVKAGTQVCVQVKVVRLSGSFASPDWSTAGCGR